MKRYMFTLAAVLFVLIVGVAQGQTEKKQPKGPFLVIPMNFGASLSLEQNTDPQAGEYNFTIRIEDKKEALQVWAMLIYVDKDGKVESESRGSFKDRLNFAYDGASMKCIVYAYKVEKEEGYYAVPDEELDAQKIANDPRAASRILAVFGEKAKN